MHDRVNDDMPYTQFVRDVRAGVCGWLPGRTWKRQSAAQVVVQELVSAVDTDTAGWLAAGLACWLHLLHSLTCRALVRARSDTLGLLAG
jgi:hypothetical protein